GQENAAATGDLDITSTQHALVITGAGSSGPNATIIDGGLKDRVFQIVNAGTTVVFENLVIQGGLAQDNGTAGALPGSTDALGGGILNNGGNVTLSNVIVQYNNALGMGFVSGGQSGHNGLGGGIYSTGGSITLTSGTQIVHNLAAGGN